MKQTSKARFSNSNYVRKLQSFNKTSKIFSHYEDSQLNVHDFAMYFDLFGPLIQEKTHNKFNAIQEITDIKLMDYIGQGYLRLTINYDLLYRKDINEQAIVSPDDVYNFFGQQIGIYLDASMLTMAEFPVFLVMIIVDIFIHLKNLWNQ